jgi:hypothetical protein
VSRLLCLPVIAFVLTSSLPRATRAQPPPASGEAARAYQARSDSLARLARGAAPDTSTQISLEPCTPNEVGAGDWLDWLNRKVTSSVCGSALWFDGLFGDNYVYAEKDATFGQVFAGMWWDERGGFDPRFRFRVKASFPQFQNRVSIIVGRDDFDNLVTDQYDEAAVFPGSLSGDEEEAWLFGMGWTPLPGRESRLQFSAGVRVTVPLDPYVRLHFRQNIFVTETSMARWRQTFFWTGRDGFGTTTRFDIERTLSPRYLIRLVTLGTVSQSSMGLDWNVGLRLYQYLGGSRAIAYLTEVFGETRREVPLHSYGLSATYRQGFLRPWLFLELSAGLYWPKDILEEKRKINPGLGFGFEMLFGGQR